MFPFLFFQATWFMYVACTNKLYHKIIIEIQNMPIVVLDGNWEKSV